MAKPTEPRPASSVILLRRGGKHADRALEVCLVRRNPDASFMPGVWVFPGGTLDPGDGEGESAYRACGARELQEEAGIVLDAGDLVPYSHWITPEIGTIRFDTHFFLALAPAHTPPKPDGQETTDAQWYEPARALEEHHAGELPLVFPTIKHLESLLAYGTANEALEAARSLKIEPILPKVIGAGDERRVVLPGDPGYE